VTKVYCLSQRGKLYNIDVTKTCNIEIQKLLPNLGIKIE